jgi:hypothetical protein
MDSKRPSWKILVPAFLVLLPVLGCTSLTATSPPKGVITYSDPEAFEEAAGPLSLVDFDIDPDGMAIVAGSNGVLANGYYKAYEFAFSAGVISGGSGLPFRGVSAPNTIGDSDINTPTPAAVDATFVLPVYAVGITNVGGQAELRIFDGKDALIGSVQSDADEATKDFIGLVSNTPINRMQYDFVGGPALEGDDLVFTQSNLAVASAGEVATTIPVGTTQTATGVSLPAGSSGGSHTGGTPSGPTPTAAATATTAPAPPPTLRMDTYPVGTSGLRWGGSWSTIPNPGGEGGGQARYADYAGASLKFTFYGTGFGLMWGLGPSLGIMRITLDGQFLADKDCYREYESFAGDWIEERLTLGHHTVLVECIGDANPASGGKAIWLGGILLVGDLE